jgi:hypothetical protein
MKIVRYTTQYEIEKSRPRTLTPSWEGNNPDRLRMAMEAELEKLLQEDKTPVFFFEGRWIGYIGEERGVHQWIDVTSPESDEWRHELKEVVDRLTFPQWEEFPTSSSGEYEYLITVTAKVGRDHRNRFKAMRRLFRVKIRPFTPVCRANGWKERHVRHLSMRHWKAPTTLAHSEEMISFRIVRKT